MMEQRTLDIIKICKGGTKYSMNDSVYNSIRRYIADECMVEPTYITETDIDRALWEAMKDYLDHCDKPSAFMWNLKDVMDRYNWDMYHAIAVVFGPHTQVRENGNYINGFDDRLNRLKEEESK